MVFGFVNSLINFFVNLILQIISTSGYAGIFILMMLSSMLVPIPSEVVMPFSGYIASQGQFNLWLAVVFASVGSLIGAVIAYYLGKYAGRRLILKYGRYVLLNKDHMATAEKWFNRYGDKAIFLGSLLPVVRSVISVPAGISKMNLKKFALYFFAGSFLWNLALAYAGFWFGKNWFLFEGYAKWLDYAVVAGIILLVGWFVYNRKRK